MSSTPDTIIKPANRQNLDYHLEAALLGQPVVPITDAHTHINGTGAAKLYAEVAQLYGIGRVYSMTHLENIEAVRNILGESLGLIAVPQFNADDLLRAFTTEWLDRIERFAELGCRICKFWSAPRAKDYAKELGQPDLMNIDSEWRRRAMQVAKDCGMMFMTHIADPDTWFQAKYTDSTMYGTKMDQYEPLERMLDEHSEVPWIAAHMGGYPEDLEFLDGLLGRHSNLFLDTSATKWMVRELSKHSRDDLIEFLTKWNGRILFGSDILTLDAHLEAEPEEMGDRGAQAASREQAFDLYASRYFALRTLWETDRKIQSPIVDPDLHMVDPQQFDENAAPMIHGQSVPDHLLKSIYRDAAANLLDQWHQSHP